MRYCTITALAAALALASPATAEPFQSFVDICMANDANAPAIERSLNDREWVEMPAESLGDLGAQFRNPSLRLNFNPNGLNEGEFAAAAETMELVLTGWGDGKSVFDIEGFRLDSCMLMSPKTDSQTLNDLMTAHLGFAPETDGELTIWAYSRKDGGFVPETGLDSLEDEALIAEIRKRQIYVIYALNEDDMTGFALGAIRPAS